MNVSRLLFFLFPILLIGLFGVVSCEKKVIELTPSPVNDTPENSFSALLGPNEFKDTVLWSQEDGGVLTISAKENGENGYPRIILRFPSDIAEGTYGLGGPLNDNQAIIEYGPLPDQKFLAIDSTGILAITTHFTESNRMRGKFVFTAEISTGDTLVPTIDVWSGNFLITY